MHPVPVPVNAVFWRSGTPLVALGGGDAGSGVAAFCFHPNQEWVNDMLGEPVGGSMLQQQSKVAAPSCTIATLSIPTDSTADDAGVDTGVCASWLPPYGATVS